MVVCRIFLLLTASKETAKDILFFKNAFPTALFVQPINIQAQGTNIFLYQTKTSNMRNNVSCQERELKMILN